MELAVDARMFGIAFALAALTALVVAVPPALRTSRVAPMQAFGGRGDAGSRGASRFRSVLVVAQVALATVLLIAAGLLIRSFAELSAVDRGYQPANALVFQLVFPPAATVARQRDAIDTIVTRLRAAPEVIAAGFARHGVLIGERLTLGRFVAEAVPSSDVESQPAPAIRPVSSGYLTAIGARIRQGRDLGSGDAGADPGIVITRATSRMLGSDGQIGRHVVWQWQRERRRLRIVGIADDIRNEGADGAPTPEVFVDYGVVLACRSASARRRSGSGSARWASCRSRCAPVHDRRGDGARRRVVREIDPGAGIDGLRRSIASWRARSPVRGSTPSCSPCSLGAAALLAASASMGCSPIRRAADPRDWRAHGARRAAPPGAGLVLRRGWY